MKKLGIIYAPRLSASAAALASAVPLYRVGPEGFKSKAGERFHDKNIDNFTMINWGASAGPWELGPHGGMSDAVDEWTNTRNAVKTALSKLKTLTILKEAGVPALEATGDTSVAEQWYNEGLLVLARRDGLSGGRGITKLHKDTPTTGFPIVDFFVKYWKKTHEYRVHVFRRPDSDGWQGPSTPLPSHNVIDIQQKRRRTNWDGPYDPMIRNFDNGWVFCHDNIKGTETELESIKTTARQAVAALGLDFGAVDILARFNEAGTLRKHVVCEINTAPGLEGKTLDCYVQAIRGYINGL